MLMSDVRKRFTKALKVRIQIAQFDESILELLQRNYSPDSGDCELELLLATEEYGDLKLDSDGRTSIILSDELIDTLSELSENQVLEYRVVTR